MVWQETRLKYVVTQEKNAIVDGPFGSAISTSDYRDNGIPLVRIKNIKPLHFRRWIGFYCTASRKEAREKQN